MARLQPSFFKASYSPPQDSFSQHLFECEHTYYTIADTKKADSWDNSGCSRKHYLIERNETQHETGGEVP